MAMVELICNLKTYEILKRLGKSKDEPKVKKNLFLKVTKETHKTEDEETTYNSKRVLKALRNSQSLPKRGEFSKVLNKGNGSDTCLKCGELGHYIKYFPMHRVDYNKYAKQVAGYEKGKDPIPMKFSKKAEADKVVNQVLASCWGNSSSDTHNSKEGEDGSMMVMKDKVLISDSLFALMVDTDNDEYKSVSLHNIKENFAGLLPE